MRLIDANAIDYENIWCTQHELWRLHNFIESLPTVDAVPVVHGWWKLKFGDEGAHYYCSNCKEESLFDIFGYQEKSKHCPNCGARMNREEET